VEELVDDDVSTYNASAPLAGAATNAANGFEDESDDEDTGDINLIASLNSAELVARLLLATKEYVDLQVKEQAERELSPLELAILEDSESLMLAQEHAVDEIAAVFDVFQSTLVDICPLPTDRFFAIAMMAAELASLDNSVRRTCLTLTNGVDRMRFVLRALQSKIKVLRARNAANQITRSTDEQQRDLQVGAPSLPSWARDIRKGMKLEYFWNEEHGWCLAEVVEEPLFVVNEIVITLFFPEDGTTHRLPFTADDKIRWRPARSGN
jgi:hypothetical protein